MVINNIVNRPGRGFFSPLTPLTPAYAGKKAGNRVTAPQAAQRPGNGQGKALASLLRGFRQHFAHEKPTGNAKVDHSTSLPPELGPKASQRRTALMAKVVAMRSVRALYQFVKD